MRAHATQLSAFAFTAFLASAPLADTLTVTISGISSDEGRLLLQIMSSEAQFEGEREAVIGMTLPARAGDMTVSVDALPTGAYGARVMHDLDGDGKLGGNLVGAPTEPWGFSNDATGNFGPPDWRAVKFELAGDARQTIHLRR